MRDIPVIAAIAVSVTLLTAGTAHAEGIPEWVKDVAGFWSEGLIDDDTYTGTLQYLIEQGIITVEQDTTDVYSCDTLERYTYNQMSMVSFIEVTALTLEMLPPIEYMEPITEYANKLNIVGDMEQIRSDVKDGLYDHCEHIEGFKAYSDYVTTALFPNAGKESFFVIHTGQSESTQNIDVRPHSPPVAAETPSFEAAVNECVQIGGYVMASSVIKNTGSLSYDVEYTIHVTTENGTIVNSRSYTTFNLAPGMSAHTRDNVGVDDNH